MTPGILFAAAGVETTENAVAVIDFQSALMLVMLVCLGFMARAIADLNRRVRDLVETRSGGSSPGPVSNGRPRSPPPASVDGVSPETLAAITAAVYVACDRPVQIVAVDEMTADQARHWSMEGRRQIFTSHRVR